MVSHFDTGILTGSHAREVDRPLFGEASSAQELDEFIMAVCRAAKLKTLHVATREVSDTVTDADKKYFDALDSDTFEKLGMRVIYELDHEIHDRSFALDNGYTFKLGRGLDIYKPVAGLAARDPSLRQVRECEIDVFGPLTE